MVHEMTGCAVYNDGLTNLAARLAKASGRGQIVLDGVALDNLARKAEESEHVPGTSWSVHSDCMALGDPWIEHVLLPTEGQIFHFESQPAGGQQECLFDLHVLGKYGFKGTGEILVSSASPHGLGRSFESLSAQKVVGRDGDGGGGGGGGGGSVRARSKTHA